MGLDLQREIGESGPMGPDTRAVALVLGLFFNDDGTTIWRDRRDGIHCEHPIGTQKVADFMERSQKFVRKHFHILGSRGVITLRKQTAYGRACLFATAFHSDKLPASVGGCHRPARAVEAAAAPDPVASEGHGECPARDMGTATHIPQRASVRHDYTDTTDNQHRNSSSGPGGRAQKQRPAASARSRPGKSQELFDSPLPCNVCGGPATELPYSPVGATRCNDCYRKGLKPTPKSRTDLNLEAARAACRPAAVSENGFIDTTCVVADERAPLAHLTTGDDDPC